MQLENTNKKSTEYFDSSSLIEPKLIQTGKINVNKLSKFLKLSEVVTLSHIEKSNQEIINQRASLSRMREMFLIENGLQIKELTIYASQKFIKIYVLTSISDCSELHYLRSSLNDIYTKRNTIVNFTDFCHDSKGYYDFWWDIENDFMWSLNKNFMEQFIVYNLFNSCNYMESLSIENILPQETITDIKEELDPLFS